MATTKKKSKKEQSIAKSFEIDVQPWSGIITSQDAYTIPEDTAVWLSGLPKLTGAIENVPDADDVYTHTANIVDFFTFKLGDTQYFCILDGANLTIYSSSFVFLATYATNVTKVEYAIQENSAIWITSPTFLITFNGSNITDLTDKGIKGKAICYWKGRIFIGNGRVITFSVPNPDRTGAVNPFDTAQGSGAITLTVSNFYEILSLIPKEDSIYIFTDRSIVSLIGTTISNDPMSWYITEIVKDVGITGVRNYVVNEHTIYFHSPFGIYEITATSPQKIDDAITDLTKDISGICYFSYRQVPYIAVSTKSAITQNSNAIYCYNMLTRKWYALNFDAKVMSNILADAWFTNSDKVYKLFGSEEFAPLHVKSKVFFNLDNIYFNIKGIVLYGRGSFNYFQEFIVMVFAGQQDNIIFQVSGGDLLQITQDEDFWVAVLKPISTMPFSMRVKQFQIELIQSDKGYSEIINIRARGTMGARYV